MTLAPGTMIAGKFRIDAPIGRGGMGVVYRAHQLPMERVVALKVLRPQLAQDARSRARFEREARMASALAHPSAVAIHDFGEHEGAAYLAMELVSGESLRVWLERGPVSTARAIDLAAQLADVLAAAARAGIVHRDLKPENVILEPQAEGERARVLDFGLAFALGPELGPRMTREGVVVGTPEYLSPEQARGEAVGPATDVYALGCILHELIVGKPPFLGGELDVLTRQMFAPPPPLRRDTSVLDVPIELDELRRAMLDKRAHARPSASEVHDRLAALDPDPDRGRARARIDGYLGPRASRMVPAAPPEATPIDAIDVAVAGAVDASLALGLAAVGIAVHPLDERAPDAAAIFAPSASDADVARLARLGLPLVVGIGAGELSRLAACLRAGAADVVMRPFGAADLARKLRRVARDRARRS